MKYSFRQRLPGRFDEGDSVDLLMRPIKKRVFEKTRNAGYILRSTTAEDGLRAGRFTNSHQDPFDRMIAAQALNGDIPIISTDAKLDGFGVRRI